MNKKDKSDSSTLLKKLLRELLREGFEYLIENPDMVIDLIETFRSFIASL